MEVSKVTNVGDRIINEDAIGIFVEKDKKMCVLCDGLGGHGMGDVASQLVISVFQSRFEEEGNRVKPRVFLEGTFKAAQERLMAEQIERHAENKMKTTAVACFADGKKLFVAHVGDSRLYIFNKNKIVKRTIDHSISQMLAISGEIKESEIRHHRDRNMLLRVLGVEWDKDMVEKMKPIPLKKCQAVLLCSDGFWGLIEDERMCELLEQTATVEEWLGKMTEEVEANGEGKNMDNYSAIAIWV